MSHDQPTPIAKPRRRWFQYSMRTLLVLVTIFCVWLGVQVERAHRQREAVAAIKALGGSVEYDYQLVYSATTGKRIKDAKPPGADWLRNLVGIDFFASIGVVECGIGATDLMLEQLHGQEHLLGISLRDKNSVSDAGLRCLGEHTSLRSLQLRNCDKITDAGLQFLSDLNKLETLILCGTQATDASLKCLERLSSLDFLDLEGTKVTDAGLEHLKGLKRLRVVHLDSTSVTEKGAFDLQKALPSCDVHWYGPVKWRIEH